MEDLDITLDMEVELIHSNEFENLYKIPNINLGTKYVCNRIGQVYRIRRKIGKMLEVVKMRPYVNRDRYIEYVLTDTTGTKIHIQAQRIVAYLFLLKPKDKDYVNHINLDRQDNRVENLEWVTQSENIKHSWVNNTNRAIRKDSRLYKK